MFQPNILLGDFNANFFDKAIADKVKQSLPNYTVLTGHENKLYQAGGTHIDGSIC